VLGGVFGRKGHFDDGNAYTGDGGYAPGGTVQAEPGILNILSSERLFSFVSMLSQLRHRSDNAGDGGKARSGVAHPEHKEVY
jgi:hypothetical protein